MKNQRDSTAYKLYLNLRRRYGRPSGQWGVWCKRPKTVTEREEVIIGAVLAQRTNWRNAERAIDALKTARVCSLAAVEQLGRRRRYELERLIRSSGFYRAKAVCLARLTDFFAASGGVEHVARLPLAKFRQALLHLSGIGPETADSILLYALHRPVFVIDEYTRRLARSRRLTFHSDYDDLQRFFSTRLPKNPALYQDFHALIVIDAKARKAKLK